MLPMPFQLILEVADYQSDREWLWRLQDANGNYLASSEVKLNPQDLAHAGFADLPAYLHHYQTRNETEVLRELGEWMGEQVLGNLRDKLWQNRRQPACLIQVRVPAVATMRVRVIIGSRAE